MNRVTRQLAGVLMLIGTVAGGAGAASAQASGADSPGFGPPGFGLRNAVFVQTDGLSGNQIVAFSRADDGALTQVGVYNTADGADSSAARSSTTRPLRARSHYPPVPTGCSSP